MVMKGVSKNIIDASKPVAPEVLLRRYLRNDLKNHTFQHLRGAVKKFFQVIDETTDR